MFVITVLSLRIMSQPLPMALALIVLSIITGLFTWLTFSKWVGLRLALIYLGGMMVIFLYVSFLAINFKFFFPEYKPILLCSALVIIASIYPPNWPNLKEKLITEVYTRFSSETLIFLIIYLLLCLLIVVKFSQCFKGALIKKF